MKDTILIIAEAGECWNGSREAAHKLIKVAAESGCDYVKFQTLDFDAIKNDDPERDWFRRIALDDNTIGFLIKTARIHKIKPLFSVPNVVKAKLLREKFDLSEIKISSPVAFNDNLLRYVSRHFSRVFLSTGMSTLAEIRNRVSLFGKKMKGLYLLHCISEYPTGPLLKKRGLQSLKEEDVHLNMMFILKNTFPGYNVGYSDHTSGLLACLCAAVSGATVIEKHITLNRSKPIRLFKSKKGYLGTDHVLSLEPPELKVMVKQIRQVEVIFGNNRWERSAGEMILKKFLIHRF